VADTAASAVARDVEQLFRQGSVAGLTDRELLDRFRQGLGRDALAFEALLTRHGPMVLAVCRRVLKDRHDVDDAFQATFLTLIERASSIRDADALGGWLAKVAHRVAFVARTNAARRSRHEARAAIGPTSTYQDPVQVRVALEEELDDMPAELREPLDLCHRQEFTREQAANELNCSVDTVRGRLARARAMLRTRLSRRGWTGAVGLAIGRHVTEGTEIPLTLRELTLRLALGEPPPAAVLGLSRAAWRATVMLRWTYLVSMIVTIGGVAAGVGIAGIGAKPGVKSPAEPKSSALPVADDPKREQSPLDRLNAGAIPTEERRPGDPKGLVAVLGDSHGRAWLTTALGSTPDGRTLVTVDYGGSLRLWDAVTLRERAAYHLRENELASARPLIASFVLAVAGRRIAIANSQGVIQIWNLAKDGSSATQLATLRGHESEILKMRFDPTGATLYSTDSDNTLRIWDVADNRPRERTVLTFETSISALAVSPDGKSVVTGSWAGDGDDRGADLDRKRFIVKFWKPDGRKFWPGIELPGYSKAVNTIEFSRDGGRLATSNASGIRVWSLSGEKPYVLAEWPAPVERKAVFGNRVIAFDARGEHLVVGGTQDVDVWSLDTSPPRRQTIAAEIRGDTSGLTFSNDGKRLVVSEIYGGIRGWDLSGPQPTEEFRGQEGHLGAVNRLVLLPDGRTLVSAGLEDETLRTWDLTRPLAGPVRTTPIAPDGSSLTLTQFAWSGNGRVLAAINGSVHTAMSSLLDSGRNDEGSVLIFDISSGQTKRRAAIEFLKAPLAVAMTAAGNAVAVSTPDGNVTIWDLSLPKPTVIKRFFEVRDTTRSSVVSLPPVAAPPIEFPQLPPEFPQLPPGAKLGPTPELTPTMIMFSPDGRRLSALRLGEVLLWDLSKNEPQLSARLDEQRFGSLKIPSRPSRLVSAADTANAESSAREATRCVFSARGDTLAVVHDAGAITLWDVSSPEPRLRATLPGHSQRIRVLTFAENDDALLSAGDDRVLIRWDLTTGKEQRRWVFQEVISSVAVARDERHLALGFANGQIKVLRLGDYVAFRAPRTQPLRRSHRPSCLTGVWRPRSAPLDLVSPMISGAVWRPR
jgi:RNA polymerase sigma factor (sigma-70 family)